MNPLLKLLNPKSESTRPILFTRTCTADGKTWQAGETGNFSDKTARDLIAADAGYDPSARDANKKRLKNLNKLLPAEIPAEPLPESWEKLPKSFSDWWKLHAAYQSLAKYHDALWDVLLSKMQMYMMVLNISGVEGQSMKNREVILQGLAAGFSIGNPPPEHVAQVEFLKGAYLDAEKECDDWMQSNKNEMIHKRILCGDEVQDLLEKLKTDVAETHALGMQLFSLRIATLGLSGRKVSELYAGSELALRYSSFDIPSLPALKLAYYENGVGARSYIDRPVQTIECLYRSLTAQAAEVSAALKAAKAELAKAQKVAS